MGYIAPKPPCPKPRCRHRTRIRPCPGLVRTMACGYRPVHPYTQTNGAACAIRSRLGMRRRAAEQSGPYPGPCELVCTGCLSYTPPTGGRYGYASVRVRRSGRGVAAVQPGRLGQEVAVSCRALRAVRCVLRRLSEAIGFLAWPAGTRKPPQRRRGKNMLSFTM